MSTKEPKQVQIHIRLPADVVDLIDLRAEDMQREMRKVHPGVVVSRVEATQAIVTQALKAKK